MILSKSKEEFDIFFLKSSAVNIYEFGISLSTSFFSQYVHSLSASFSWGNIGIQKTCKYFWVTEIHTIAGLLQLEHLPEIDSLPGSIFSVPWIISTSLLWTIAYNSLVCARSAAKIVWSAWLLSLQMQCTMQQVKR